MAVPSAWVGLHLPRTDRAPNLERHRSCVPRRHSLSRPVAAVIGHADLHGRPPAPAGLRALLVDGLLDRRLAGRHPQDHDDASERGLLPPQRYLRERQGDGDHLLDAAWRLPDLDQHRPRSGLSDRAADPPWRVPADARCGVCRATMHSRRRRTPDGRRSGPLPGKESVPAGAGRDDEDSRGSTSSRRQIDVPGISRDAGNTMRLAVPGRARERVASALALAACLAVGMGPGVAVNTRAQQVSAADLHILPVRGNVYMLVGAGANITLSVGGEGTLLVDAGPAASADAVVAAVQQLARQITSSPMPIKPCAGLGCVGVSYPSYLGTIASPAPPRPIQFIVNTNGDADHVGGNARIAQAGTTIGGGPGLGAFVGIVKESATIYAHENVLARMAAAKMPTGALPTESFARDLKQYFT